MGSGTRGAQGMTRGGRTTTWRNAATRLLALAARPVRTAQGRGGIVLQPYRGYGSRREAFLIGRAFLQSAPTAAPHGEPPRDDVAAHLRDIGRRIARRAVAGATVRARFLGAECRAETDAEGYFRIHLEPREPPPADRAWHAMALELEGERPVQAEGQIYVPPETSRFVVISDIDDTLMVTGVASKLGMLWRLFVEGAETRMPFPGVPALYRALHAGAGGAEGNPLLYVSRAPWGIYDVLDAFFRIHDVPIGPILFLREWGLSWRSPLPRRAEDHKDVLIRAMLDLYRDRPFVLIGDSGQHDPEIYRRIVDENPGRVLTVMIRNVSRDPARIGEIEQLAMAVAQSGSSLVLASDSAAMAEHAARLGLVPPRTAETVAAEMAAGRGRFARAGTRRVALPGRAATAEAVAQGALRQAVEGEAANGGTADGPHAEGMAEAPPNVVVEPKRRV